jgi:hypothetical protein
VVALQRFLEWRVASGILLGHTSLRTRTIHQHIIGIELVSPVLPQAPDDGK